MDGSLPYVERLWVPASWWIVAVLLTGTLWLAFFAALPALVANVLGLVALALVAVGLLRFGALRVAVTDSSLLAGRATLPLWAVGSVVALSADQARALRGVASDASAFLVVRPYVPRAVRVEVADPQDPTPYWYVATRHPERLAAALEAARVTGG
ncbi:DUF3093 domain-containing protein [Tenggerimyces flavus]|uniref:DUF3093 domain-containing protein n=1 Tax=Tenggerimyces flavus TaxID=1708749 RepID=A0ABV7YJX3_9ACTN|nr:DUF3093 domain-containing protein [Tenggerimyces flavus]MBM7787707.1 hypothetical protein [Tenggerimyces flavus]